MRNFKILAIVLFLSASTQSHAGFFSKKPWCDSWLQREPREIKAFSADTRKAQAVDPRILSADWGYANPKYSAQFIEQIDKVFAIPRYKEGSPELQSRLIAYTLIKVVRIPYPRTEVVQGLSTWLLKQLNSHDFSFEDLQRLRLAYGIFLNRHSRLRDRPRRTGEKFLYTALDTGGVMALEGIFLPHLAGMIIPGAHALPLPVFSIARSLWVQGRNYLGDKLAPDALEASNKVDAKFLELMAEHLSFIELQKRWDQSLKQIIGSTGIEIQEGLLLQNVRAFCQSAQLIYSKHPQDSFSLLNYITHSLSVVNPVDWPKIHDSFALIRQTARELKIPAGDAQNIFEAMKNIADTWNSNAAARKSVDDLLKTSYQPQPLPEQSSTPDHAANP